MISSSKAQTSREPGVARARRVWEGEAGRASLAFRHKGGCRKPVVRRLRASIGTRLGGGGGERGPVQWPGEKP